MDNLSARFLSFDAAIVLLTWITTVLGAGVVFLRRTRLRTWRNFLTFLLPPQIWHHPSPRQDVLYFAASTVLLPVLAVPFLISNAAATAAVYRGLTALFGVRAQGGPEPALWFALLAALLVVADLATFLLHRMLHKIGPLWDLHKVHHAPEFLTPLTNKRIHPFEIVIDIGGTALLIGLAGGTASYALGLAPLDSAVAGLDVYFLANFFSFYHLRHSHIDMTYPAWLERWLLSPAQHQLHHSREPHHWDHNFGLLLAVWDRLAGTLLLAQPAAEFRLGLPEQEQVGYRSIGDFFITPIVRIGQRVSRRLKPQEMRPL